MNAGAGGRPSLRRLCFAKIALGDLSSLANALLHGGGRGLAPNLEEVWFIILEPDAIEELKSLIARGAMANITVLQFSSVEFDSQSMGDLMDGFRQSMHKGSSLKRLIFSYCYCMDEGASVEVSLELIEGLKGGIFPNLQELSTPHSALLVGEVAELVDVLKNGAPCARTLRAVEISEAFGEVLDIDALQAILSQATVVLKN